MLYSNIKRLLIIIAFTLFTLPACAHENLSLEWQHANLPDAIRLMAKLLNMNVVISPSVQGSAMLQLADAAPADAFSVLLAANGLARWRIGSIWFVAPREELIKRKQQELKWQEVDQDTAPLLTKIWQIHYARAEDIGRLLQEDHASLLSRRGRVRVDARTNVIFIEECVGRIARLQKLIRQLDVPVRQIVIAARLASVDNDFERDLGIDFTVKSPAAQVVNGSLAPALRHESGLYSLAVAKLADGSLLDVKLSALENAGHAELISSPSLFTANQQPASIEAGEEVPYQEVSESGGTAVVFKKAVLGLKVTPQVLPGNTVLLQLQINQDRPSSKMVMGMPTISTRQISTSVLVKNGQTIVLGGIYETNAERGERRLPFISELPLLGWLFRQQNIRENKRELLIFMTPTIITQQP